MLPTGKREAGGLPEVFTGCGVAIRRAVFNDLGGYDPSFHYYAEEYDLSARIIVAGFRIVHDRRFRVLHHKDVAGRDMNTILARLVRNNGWVMQRYAPGAIRERFIRDTIERYGSIAVKENARDGFALGLDELSATLDDQPRREMTMEQWDRFTGLAHARVHLGDALGAAPWSAAMRSIAVVARGKNGWAVEQALRELGWQVADEAASGACPIAVIGTLSPGPMLDALDELDALDALDACGSAGANRAAPGARGCRASAIARTSGCHIFAPWALRGSVRACPSR
jgi:hypothetical protein